MLPICESKSDLQLNNNQLNSTQESIIPDILVSCMICIVHVLNCSRRKNHYKVGISLDVIGFSFLNNDFYYWLYLIFPFWHQVISFFFFLIRTPSYIYFVRNRYIHFNKNILTLHSYWSEPPCCILGLFLALLFCFTHFEHVRHVSLQNLYYFTVDCPYYYLTYILLISSLELKRLWLHV